MKLKELLKGNSISFKVHKPEKSNERENFDITWTYKVNDKVYKIVKEEVFHATWWIKMMYPVFKRNFIWEVIEAVHKVSDTPNPKLLSLLK